MRDKLRKHTGDSAALFEVVYLIDDFVGSGKTLIRPEGQVWTGKLIKFCTQNKDRRGNYFVNDPVLCVHHYLASHAASIAVKQSTDKARAEMTGEWLPAIEFTFGLVLPPNITVTAERHAEFMGIIDRCYDDSIKTTHTDIGGTDDVRLGFSECALPLVLEHNTPNNSIALLWADTPGSNGQHAMRPLFRRRQRHV